MTVLVTPDGLRRAERPKGFPFPAPQPTRVGASPGFVPLLSRAQAGATYEAMWRCQPWVWVCVNKLVKGIARLPLKTYRFTDEDGARERARDHPLSALMAKPWPRGSAWALKAGVVWDLAVHGNALLVKARTLGRMAPPGELWRIPWRNIETVGDPTGFVDRFVFHGQQARFIIQPQEAVHFSDTPGLVGVSPLEPLRQTLGLEDAAQRWSAGHFQRGASPGGLFRTERKLDPKSIPRLRAELEMLYGGVDNAGRFAVVDQDLDFRAVAQSAVDTALIEQRKLSREEVAACYDIPPPVIGILDRATFSNVTELHKALYVDTLGPRLTLLEETFEAQLVRDEPEWPDVFMEFDLGEILKGDLEARARAHLMFQQSSTLSVNERRRLENLPPIDHPDADRPLLPVNMVPIGASTEDLEARSRLAQLAPPAPPPTPAPNGSS